MIKLSISTEYLNQIKTISSLKVLIAFLAMGEKLGKKEFDCSIPKIAMEYGMSQNSVRSGIKELEELKFIEVVQRNADKTNAYKILVTTSRNEAPSPSNIEAPTSKVEAPPVIIDSQEKREEYMLATAARKKKEQDEAIENEINNIDFNNIDIYTEDINSVTVVNKNIYMTDKELGKLARRVVNEIYAPTLRTNQDQKFFAVQMRHMKDLLVEYRTEQVVAAIKYWTEVSPPPNGLVSLQFLKYKRKNRSGVSVSNVMIALDYYKQQFIANAHEYKKDEIEQKQAERAKKEQEAKELAAKKAEEVANMTNEEFIAGMLGRFKLNIKKE
jgi:DNA-binding MarR family transcriptional regulator